MYKDIEVGRSMLYRACASADPFPDPLLAAVAKVYCNEMALRVSGGAIQVHGGYGFTASPNSSISAGLGILLPHRVYPGGVLLSRE
jgi:alkylation response protein AidB-like acyl-CoA dehydrogenase